MNVRDRNDGNEADLSSGDDAGLRWGLIVQIVLAVAALGASGFALYECAQIGNFESYYRDTLNAGRRSAHLRR